MSANFEFVGVLNLFNICPDFLYPVYKQKDQLYFHNGKDNVITDFDPITKSVHSRIIFLNSGDIEIVNKAKKKYSKKSAPVYAFQESEKKIFCAGLNDMIKYLNLFKTTDPILKRQIKKFINYKYSSSDLILRDGARELTCTILGSNSADSKKNYEVHAYFPSEEVMTLGYDRLHFVEETDKPLVHVPRFKASEWHKVQNNLFERAVTDNRLLNKDNTSLDYNALRKSFDRIIKNISCADPIYNICIRCLYAIIRKDEKELRSLMRKYHRAFARLQNSQLLDENILKYIQLNDFVSTDYK